jgi:protein ImuB
MDQAFGLEEEVIEPVQSPEPFQERLPCLEPICSAGGIEIALTRLLETLCTRLQREGKGLRTANLKCFRIDGKVEQISIGTNKGSHHIPHLFKLFELKISTIAPGEGIDLFMLEAPKVEELAPLQESLWKGGGSMDDMELTELMDRIINKAGSNIVRRFLPCEHYWPERSLKPVYSLTEPIAGDWPRDRPRPIHILSRPESIEVTAPIPDYPPMMFRYQGKLHKIIRAEGPERIENEWWIDESRHRDYYAVEDEAGARYWLFRAGHYSADRSTQWYIHGFFA